MPELATKEHCQRLTWQEESSRTRDPAAATFADRATWHDIVSVRMVIERPSPGVQYSGEAEAATAQMLGIGSQGFHALGRRLEQGIVDDSLMAASYVAQLGRQRKGDQKVLAWQSRGVKRNAGSSHEGHRS